jgi:hypothetical protein
MQVGYVASSSWICEQAAGPPLRTDFPDQQAIASKPATPTMHHATSHPESVDRR